MSRRQLIGQAYLDDAFQTAMRASSPDAVIDQLLGAVEDPAKRADDFSIPYAMILMAEIQERCGRRTDALATLRRAMAEDIRDPIHEPRGWLARLLVELSEFDEAAEVFRAVRKYAASYVPYQVYGEALEQAGLTGEALNVLLSGEQHMLRISAPDDAAELHQSAVRIRTDMGFPLRTEHNR